MHLYVHYNRPKTFGSEIQKFNYDLKNQFERTLEKRATNSEFTMFQAISFDFFLNICVLSEENSLTPQKISTETRVEAQSYPKKLNRNFNRVTKQAHEPVSVILWRNFKKKEQNRYLSEGVFLDKDSKSNSRLISQFVVFPTSPQTLFRVYLVSKYIFSFLEQILYAVHFQTNFLPSLYSEANEAPKINPFRINQNFVLEWQNAIFSKLRKNSSKNIHRLGKAYHGVKDDISQINLSGIANQSTEMSADSTIFNSFINQSSIQDQSVQNLEPGGEFELAYNGDPTKNEWKNLSLSLLSKAMTARSFDERSDRNYEELEFLGDVVLKLLSTLQCFFQNPRSEQSGLHDARKKIISNANLHRKAVLNKLFLYIRTTNLLVGKYKFAAPPYMICYDDEPADYYQNTLIPKVNKSSNARGYFYVPPKTLADVVEALIGAIYQETQDLRKCQGFLYSFGVLASPIMVPPLERPIHKYQLPHIYAQFEHQIKYQFKMKGLLMQTFTHRDFKLILDDEGLHGIKRNFSLMRSMSIQFMEQQLNDATFYERLQFLGDSVLDLLVTKMIFSQLKTSQNGTEGILSGLKQAAVNNRALGYIGLGMGLHHLLLFTVVDSDDIIKELNYLEEKIRGGSINPRNCIQKLTHKGVKVISDVLQALVGAIFIDNCFDFDITCSICQVFLGDKLRTFLGQEMQDPIHLQFLERLKSKGFIMPKITQKVLQVRDGKQLFVLKDSKGTKIDECYAVQQKQALFYFHQKYANQTS